MIIIRQGIEHKIVKRLLFVGCFLAVQLFQVVYAQKIKGIVVDEDNLPLEFASVALLQPNDSLLVKYTSTDKQGQFELSEFKENTNYLFQVFLMTYQTNQRIISVDKSDLNLGTIKLGREVNALDEVIVNAIVPIKIKQDTIAFNAKAFKVKQDDNVEDLVKKLPGVEMATDGSVSAHGQEITKILVDGKEFFTDDPTIALKNLTADAIETIEIIDEGSDDSRVTGMSDGEKRKIINLVLKPGRKTGYFGKFGVGVGTQERYSSNFDVNRFTNKTQLAVFGNLNNINNTGAQVFKRDGSKEDTSGYLTTGTSGANYSYEIKKDYDFNLNYHFGYSDRDNAENSDRTEFRKETSFRTLKEESSENVSNNHNLNFSLRNRSLKESYFDLRGGFKIDNRASAYTNFARYFNAQEIESTNNDRETSSEDDRNNGRLNFNFRKKLNTTGRNFGISSGFSFFNNDDFDNQNSLITNNVSNVNTIKTTAQQTSREDASNGLNFNVQLKYMEPIVKNHFLSFQSKFIDNTSMQDINQLKLVNLENQTPLIYDLSYTNLSFENMVGYEFNKNKFQLNLYGVLENNSQELGIGNKNEVDTKYQDFLPKFTLNYEYKKGSSVRFKYEKKVVLPSTTHLNPVVNDFNPLSIRVGNTGITPEKTDEFNFRMNSHNFSTTASFFTYLLYKKTSNAIVSKRFTDDNFVQNTSFDNNGSENRFIGIVHYGNKIKGAPIRYTLKLRANTNEYTAIIEDEYNNTNTKNVSVGLTLNNDNKNNVDVILGTNFDISKTTYSLNDKVRDYFKQNYFTKFDWDITKSLNFNSQFDYSLYTDNNFDSQSVPVLNMALEYAFLKGNRGNLKMQVFDILDKSIVIERTSAANYFEETFKSNIGTYAMLSFTYSIKPPVGKENNSPEKRYKHDRS